MTGELYYEAGASGWPLLWGPLFALAGALLEWASGPRPHLAVWVATGLGLCALAAVWVFARRHFLSVRVTATHLWQGGDRLPVSRIAALQVPDATQTTPVPGAARVLGGWSVPRRFTEVPLWLDDGTVVLAWARDAEALRTALRSAMAHSAP